LEKPSPAASGEKREGSSWQDRLSRENGRATAEVWEALDKAGARLVCAAEGLDTATGDHGGAVFSAQAHDPEPPTPSGISLS
jgi:hypothetical protein